MNISTEKCPVCLSQHHQTLYTLEKGQLLTCKNCNLVFYSPRATLDELEAFYNSQDYRDYYQNSLMTEKVFSQKRYQQLHQLINHYNPKLFFSSPKYLLDIGCGSGNFLSVASQNGWEVTGSELSSIAVQKANQMIENTVLTGDILSLDLPDNYYDLITIYHVIEHLIDPISTLEKIKSHLKPQGIAFIETPNIKSLGSKIRGQKWSNITPPEHISYFNPNSLSYCLKKAGFNSVYVFTNSPQSVESVKQWSAIAKQLIKIIYKIAPSFGLGATLQAIAIKDG